MEREPIVHKMDRQPLAQKRKSYSITFKLKAIETAEKTSKEVASHEYKRIRRLCEWCSKKDD